MVVDHKINIYLNERKFLIMKTKGKMLKKLIAVLCAATMVASGAVASVGAVNPKKDITKAKVSLFIAENRIIALRYEMETLIEEVGASMDELDKQFAEDTDAFNNLTNKIADANESNKDDANKLQELNERINERINEIKEKKAKILELDEEIKKVEKEKIELEEKINSLSQQLEKEKQE